MTTYSDKWHYENCMGLTECEQGDPHCPHNHFLKGVSECNCPELAVADPSLKPQVDNHLNNELDKVLIELQIDSLYEGAADVKPKKDRLKAQKAILNIINQEKAKLLNNLEQSIKQHTVPEGKHLVTRSYVLNSIEFERNRIKQEEGLKHE